MGTSVATWTRTATDKLAKKINPIETLLKDTISKTTIERDQKEQFRRRLESELVKRDDLITQLGINKTLVWAVFAMIFVMGILFWSLRFLPNSLALIIIEQRVLVEVLSMGFLLVTIIILGTGKLLRGESLAALLGTIAGYIFARKAAEGMAAEIQRAARGSTQGVPPPQPATPLQSE